MSGLGFIELGAVFLLILILFGPRELPKLARFMARLIYEMKNIFQRLEKEWNLSSEENNSHSRHLSSNPFNNKAEVQPEDKEKFSHEEKQ